MFFLVPVVQATRSRRALALRTLVVSSIVALAFAGCGDHGFLGTDYNPKGGIVVTDATTNAILTPTSANPYQTTKGGFSIGLTETNFSGPYTITVSGWSNGTNVPCFEPHTVTPTGGTSVELFSADNAVVPTATTPNPCIVGGTESALISDGKGNSTSFYFVLSAISG